MSDTAAMLKDGGCCGGTPTHSHNHLAPLERTPEVSYITPLLPPGAKLKMTPSDSMCVNANKANSQSHRTSSKVISRDAACLASEAGRGLSEPTGWKERK